MTLVWIDVSKATHARGYDADEPDEQEFKPLTAAQALALRTRNPALSPWQVVGMQLGAGFLVAVLALGVSGRAAVGWSALYGALVVLIPAALFARGLMSQFSSLNAVAASLRFFVWEAVKLGLSVAMIAAAPRLIEDLSWLALMAGLIVTLKVYWLALLLRPRRKD